jgi:hypothetical protein
LATKIQIRRDTLANWTSNNPILANGEISFVTDLNRIKVGDGTQNWLDLGYLEADAFIGSVIMGVDTEGLYVESISAGNGISVSGSGVDSASVTVTNEGVLALAGTTNEIDISSSTGSVTLSLPETIHANLQGNVTGNSDTASKLSSAKTIALSGDVVGSVEFDGSGSVNISTDIQPDSVALGTDTTGNYVQSVTGSGDGISVAGTGEGASVTVSNTGVTSLAGTTDQVTVSASVGAVTIGLPNTVTIQSDLNVLGDFTVSGSATVINTQTLVVEDKNIEIGKVDEPTDITANGGGITLKGATDKTFNWIDTTDSWTSSENIDLASGKVFKVNGTEILSPTEYTGNAATATKLATARAIELAGDVSGSASFDGSASASITTSLADTSVSANSYGSASAVSTFTVDSKGRLTAASNTAIEIAQSAVSNLTTDLSGKAALESPTFTGTPAAPTASARTNTTQIATTAFVYEEVNKASIDTKTASYTLAVADAGKVIEMNVASANDLTIPLNDSVAIPIGSTIDIIQYGEGQTTIVATSGVTIRSKEGNLKLTGQYSGATLYKRGTDEWVVVGDLTT